MSLGNLRASQAGVQLLVGSSMSDRSESNPMVIRTGGLVCSQHPNLVKITTSIETSISYQEDSSVLEEDGSLSGERMRPDGQSRLEAVGLTTIIFTRTTNNIGTLNV